MSDRAIKAVLGPTNTGKTHLAIERMCAHSSGTMGFPLRLLAREVYDRVVAIKGPRQVALITGEERIEPADARYFCCTAEAMARDGGGTAFVALDEAQIGSNHERGHIFTDRLLNARGRDETMLLGAATLEPLVRALIPEAEITDRPRFSTLKHIGPRKLSRLPPRSAIVAFSAEQVYVVAEMLRRFRGGCAVVMGALSPETRNKQVAMFQAGEVDYIVATDAIGMGLNLDINHVAFASLSKFDGIRKRRLMPSEMAQIAGRAGRHQRDGTFGVLAGMGQGARGSNAPPPEFTEEEVYAIEEHRFAPLTHLYWRDAQPRFDTIGTLIADLERPPHEPELRLAPEAIDLAVLKKLADEPLADGVRGARQVQRFWDACSLPDFRQSGADNHARFVARLWQDLRGGYLGADYLAARISELDNMQGDIATLQGRIAAIRSWAYICQRPDWVMARDEMASRAHAVEARLSDALHARLTERFVNRRTAILMKSTGIDTAMLPVTLDDDGTMLVEDEPIGRIDGFRFSVDPAAAHSDRKMLLAAGERALPRILTERVHRLIAEDLNGVSLERGLVVWDGQTVARLEKPANAVLPGIVLARELSAIPEPARDLLTARLTQWLDTRLSSLKPLERLADAARSPDTGSQGRALLLALIDGHGVIARSRAGIEHLPAELRPFLRRLGVVFGALDIFVPALIKPAPRTMLSELRMDRRPLQPGMVPTIAGRSGQPPAGYRRAGDQFIRVDMAERLTSAAFRARSDAGKRRFVLDAALPISIGLTQQNWRRLLGDAGFRCEIAPSLRPKQYGPPRPDSWQWRPARTKPSGRSRPAPPRPNGAFAGLAELVGRE